VANTSLTGSFLNKITVAESFATGNLQLSNDSATGGSFLNAVDVVFNFVGGSAELFHNTAGLFRSVLGNEVTNNLECAANKPSPEGSFNTAKQMQGQCGLL
jgi:hypothetical protein